MQIFIKFIFVLGQMSCELLWWCIIYSFDIVNFFLVYSETCMVMVPDWHYPQKFLHNCLMWYMARNTIFVVFVKKKMKKNHQRTETISNYFILTFSCNTNIFWWLTIYALTQIFLCWTQWCILYVSTKYTFEIENLPLLAILKRKMYLFILLFTFLDISSFNVQNLQMSSLFTNS